MCNIAGYIGTQDATPILIELLRKQEGLNGGFFTGIATHDGARLLYHKVQGELKTLLTETEAETLRGKMGIAHSRTPSGGDGRWAHPFTTERDGAVKLCYIANGAAGRFAKEKEEHRLLAEQLIREGFDIPNKLTISGDKYLRLSSGETVHMSDVMCQLIYRYRQSGLPSAEAMTAAFTEMPAEIVGLMIEEDFSDRIFFSRINMPIFVGFDESGAYIASSPTAFPETVTEYQLMPPLTSGIVFKDHFELVPYPAFSEEVTHLDEETVSNAEEAILALLKQKDEGFREMAQAVQRNLPENALNQTAATVYLAIARLLVSKRIEAYDSRQLKENQSAPLTLFRPKVHQ